MLAAVEVHKEKPPAFVMVTAPTAPFRIGSTVWTGPPLIIGVWKQAGQIVAIIPNPREITDTEGTWLPVEPPPGEVRYIRASAVQKPAAAPANVVALPAGGPAPGQDADALYKRAIEAEKWNPQEAITLYNQGATVDANADRRLQALNRANYIRESLRNPSPTLIAGPTPGADVQTANTPAVSKVYPLAPAAAAVTPAVRLSPPQGGAPTATNSVSATPTASWSGPSSAALAPAAPANGGSYSSGPGLLQMTRQRPLEGGKMYALLSDRGTPFYYVTAEPGVNLEPYLNHRVECFGQAIYSGELRHNYMRVRAWRCGKGSNAVLSQPESLFIPSPPPAFSSSP